MYASNNVLLNIVKLLGHKYAVNNNKNYNIKCNGHSSQNTFNISYQLKSMYTDGVEFLIKDKDETRVLKCSWIW